MTRPHATPRPCRLLLSLALLAAAAALADDAQPPVLTWGPAPLPPRARRTPTPCNATAAVPVDHADPSGPSFQLAVIKAPARDPAPDRHAFWNPGGPGDAGTAYLAGGDRRLPGRATASTSSAGTPRHGRAHDAGRAMLRQRRSRGGVLGRRLRLLPVTPDGLAADSAGRAAFNAACVARNGALLAHVSTADNARDLDLLRQAVGDDKLSYYGTSYAAPSSAPPTSTCSWGSCAPPCSTGGHANLGRRPGRDADLSTFVRIGSDFGSQQTIRAFMDQCGAVDATACAFSAGSPGRRGPSGATPEARGSRLDR
ncbi:MAG: hypothetical protein U1E59_15910 [Amaricoccus sp.]